MGLGVKNRPPPPPSTADVKQEGGGSGGGSHTKKKVEEDDGRRSRNGKTAREHLMDLKERIKKNGGGDLVKKGWTCVLDKAEDSVGDNAGESSSELVPVYVSPDGASKFRSRNEVMSFLGVVKKERTYPREECYLRAKEYRKKWEAEDPLPLVVGPLTIVKLGKIDYQREAFHSAKNLWPIGFTSSWKDLDTGVVYESVILDGALSGEGPLGEQIDGPLFAVTVKKEGEKPDSFHGKSPEEAWKKALPSLGETIGDRFGLLDPEVRKRIEGLKHSHQCTKYRYMRQDPPPGEKTKDGKGGGKGAGGKEGGAKAKKEGGKAKEKKNSDKAIKAEAAKLEKAKEKERKEREKAEREEAAKAKKEAAALAKEKQKEENALKRKLAAEEAAKKRKEQEIERQWQARYPLEDLALGAEAEALRQAEEKGQSKEAGRAAAKACVEIIELGYSPRVALEAAKTAALQMEEGSSTVEEAIDAAMAVAEETGMDVDEEGESGGPALTAPPVVDDEQMYLRGASARMLFTEKDVDGEEGKEGDEAGGKHDRWYTGWISNFDTETKQGTVAFYEGEAVDIKLPDQDFALSDQGKLQLPDQAPGPQRAATFAADCHELITFFDNFRNELALPKGGIDVLVHALHSPASSPYLSDMYYALLKGSMEAAQHHQMIVPLQWQGEFTLSHYTWPEVLRRWLNCGPLAESNRRYCPDALAATSTLSAGGIQTLPQGHIAMLKCLVDSVMDHPNVKSMIDHRVDHVSELKQRWAQQQKEFKDTEKQMLVDKMAREANQLAAAGEADDEADSRPMLEIPDELLNELPGEKENQERLKKIDGIQSAHERLLNQWEKKKQTREREEERIEEKLQQDEKRFYERHHKQENDFHTKINKATVRYNPLGMDRYSNRYWWFPAEKGCVYVEPAQPTPNQPGVQDDQARPFQWRMYSDEESIRKLRETLNEKGTRESELIQNLGKACEKLGSEFKSLEEGVGIPDKQENARLELTLSTDIFNAIHLEGKNVAEVLQRALDPRPEWLQDWANRLQSAGDCTVMGELLLQVEDNITGARKRKGQNASGETGHAMDVDGSEGGASASVKQEEDGADTAKEGSQWLTEGSDYIGHKVRRMVLGEDRKPAGAANGKITGWLPAHLSDFYCKETGQPAALWRVEFLDEDIGMEDLEELEVQSAIAAYKALTIALQSTGPSGLPPGWKRIPRDDQGHYQYVAPDGNTFRTLAAAKAHSATMAVDYEELAFADEGNVDMVEAGNKPSRRSLWTSSLQRHAWRSECQQAGKTGAVVKLMYSSAVFCDTVCRFFGIPREQLSSFPRRGKKRTRGEVDVSDLVGLNFTDSGRQTKKVSYKEASDDDFE